MSEQTIRSVAKELAGEFYELVRSAEKSGEKVQMKRGERAFLQIDPSAFRKTFPTFKDYITGKRHGRMVRKEDGTIYHTDDGSTQYDTPGWLYWYEMARQRLVEMLNRNDVSEIMKQRIMDAIIEDREKEVKQGGKPLNVHQRRHLQQ